MTKSNPIRDSIARVMADGRERTVFDVMTAINTKNRTAVQDAITSLINMGLLSRDIVKTVNMAVYRAVRR